MYCYELNGKILLSESPNELYGRLPLAAIQNATRLYALYSIEPRNSRSCHAALNLDSLFQKEENLSILWKNSEIMPETPMIPGLLEKLEKGCVSAVNTRYRDWHKLLSSSQEYKSGSKKRIHVVGLGDVGSTLITGLRLLGGDCVSDIGIYDLDANKIKRMLYEGNQIHDSFHEQPFPEIKQISPEELFDCDFFAFCVTAGIPPVGSPIEDVRLYQYEANSRIISHYARLARECRYNGIFGVVSDPVDQLCKAALIASNETETGAYDGNGMNPEQIHGYGLGVMNARAVYYSKENALAPHYEKHGRAFGPHGEGLVIADSIENYNEQLSLLLTQKTVTANHRVRETGFKPYIAPALSSGTLSILNTLRGEWHYSSTFMGNAFFGSKNRLGAAGLEVEQLPLPSALKNRLSITYERLCSF